VQDELRDFVIVGKYFSNFQPSLVSFANVDTGRLVPLENCQESNFRSRKEVHPTHQIIIMKRKNEHWET